MRAAWAWVFCLLATDATACRQALALGLDVSGSVDATEYRLQFDGLAQALRSKAVQDALLGNGDAPVRIMVYEWSGANDARVVLPWSEITQKGDIAAAADVLRRHQRRAQSPSTALGAALETGYGFLAQQPDCWTHTLDISGDGPSNTGPRPQDIPRPATIIVNGLVIGADDPSTGDQRNAEIKELSSYYRAYVIHGPGSFVETAAGFDAYPEAMERKLLRELQVIAIGGVVNQ